MQKVNLAKAARRRVADPDRFALADFAAARHRAAERSKKGRPRHALFLFADSSQADFKKTGAALLSAVATSRLAEGLHSALKAEHKGPRHLANCRPRAKRLCVERSHENADGRSAAKAVQEDNKKRQRRCATKST